MLGYRFLPYLGLRTSAGRLRTGVQQMKHHGHHPSAECHFCRVENTVGVRNLCSNAYAFAFLTNSPIVPGHTLIVPVRCVVSADELEMHELQAMFDIRSRLKPVLGNLFEAEGFNYAWNEGLVAGQTVPHLHLHMVPRRDG